MIQDTHEFGFGSAVGAKQIVDPAYRKYAQAFYDNFEWAVLENALKWKQMEKSKVINMQDIRAYCEGVHTIVFIIYLGVCSPPEVVKSVGGKYRDRPTKQRSARNMK